MEISDAYYGVSEDQNINILNILKNKNGYISKNENLNKLFGLDPYPLEQKHICVFWNISQNDLVMEIKNHDNYFNLNKNYIGYNNFSNENLIHLPNMYTYHIIDSSYNIKKLEIMTKNNEIKIIENEKDFQSFYTKHYFCFPDKFSIDGISSHSIDKIKVYYSRFAKYKIIVYEIGEYLLKDLCIGIEIPLYKLNLIYHFYPLYHHQFMSMHMHYLKQLDKIINNKMIISVCADNNHQYHMDYLTKNLTSSIIFAHVINNPSQAEASSFSDLLKHVYSVNGDEYTFYAHTKGFKYDHKSLKKFDGIGVWIELMYLNCISNIDILLYKNANAGGTYKYPISYPFQSIGSVPWHYPGSFYWIKQIYLTQNYNYITKFKYYFISEALPGMVIPSGHNCLVFSDIGVGYRKVDYRYIRDYKSIINTTCHFQKF